MNGISLTATEPYLSWARIFFCLGPTNLCFIGTTSTFFFLNDSKITIKLGLYLQTSLSTPTRLHLKENVFMVLYGLYVTRISPNAETEFIERGETLCIVKSKIGNKLTKWIT